jgi:hypothetical protein
MVEQVTFQTIFQFLQTVGILVGVYYYITTIRTNQRNQEISIKNQELTLQSQELTRKAQEQALETRQAQLFMQIYSKFTEENWTRAFFETQARQWQDTDDYIEKYDENVESRIKWATLANYYEGVGVLVKRGLIDVSLVDDLMSGGIMRFWEKFEYVIKETRKRYNFPQRAEYVEYLYNQIKTVVEEQHPELKT